MLLVVVYVVALYLMLGGQSKYLWVTNTKAIPPLIISIIKDDVINILPVL